MSLQTRATPNTTIPFNVGVVLSRPSGLVARDLALNGEMFNLHPCDQASRLRACPGIFFLTYELKPDNLSFCVTNDDE